MKAPHSRGVSAALLLTAAILTTTPAHAQLSVQWIRQYGTSADDHGQAIAVDVQGQSWVSGYTSGNLGGTNAGGQDLFLSRLSAGGSVDFISQRGGSGNEVGVGVALVGSGTVFTGGYTNSGTIDGQSAPGGLDALTVRYDTSGTWQGTMRLGSSASDLGYALAGNSTHLLVGGYTFGSFDGQTNAGGADAFLSKRDSTGAVVWTRYAGTSGYDYGRGATFDNAGNAYLTGYTEGSFSGFTNAGGTAGATDLFVARYDSAGNRTLLKQFGVSGYDDALDVKVDGSGNIYLAGSTQGALGGQTNAGGYGAFVMKLDSAGNVLWTRLLGGSNNDGSSAIALDGAGHVWIDGNSSSTFGGHTNVGGDDAFVAEYDSNGTLLGTTFLSTSGNEVASGLAIGPDGAAYVTGWTAGALGGPNAGSNDVFVAKITAAPEPSAALLLAAGAGLLLRRRRG